MYNILFIGIGGFFGAISRYLVSKSATLMLGNLIPFGTLIVNIIGSFALGYIFTLSIERLVISENFRLFIGIGFLGAFTTFSTFSLETIHLIEDGSYISSILYIGSHLVLCLAGTFLGIFLARL